jgi:hypothetical protein
MRNISFALTTKQFRDRTKTVTRRLGWLKLKVGDELQGCVKRMGLKPGEKIEKLGRIRVTSLRRERLDAMNEAVYGNAEAIKEGFPNMTGWAFVNHFCDNMKCKPSTEVTRIEFEYLD